jgi:succinate-semialdehyde dehydrogenase / glutarate-semialdehyde dehydrogenase
MYEPGVRQIAPAFAAGCTVTIKPAEETPLSALALCAIANEAGVPKGVMNVVTVARSDVLDVGTQFCNSDYYRKISFTGSTNVGKWLLKEGASTMKRVRLAPSF